ncbi:MAG TPA: hypothetical protein DER01_15465 [Phycisphaerales bacterium]|nr:hypothetical protein [Phycisphaerales bacterium]
MIGMMILSLSMVATAEDGTNKIADKQAGPKWEDQPTGVKRLFEQQAPNWVKIGDKLWCVEVMKEAQKRAKRGKGDAYHDASAPWFYEPIGDVRCRWIGEVYKHMKLDAPEGYEVLEGTVNYLTDDGFFIYQPKVRNNPFVYSLDKPKLNSKVVTLGKKQTGKYTSGAKSYDAYNQYREFELAIVPQQLFDYLHTHQIKEFPVWRAKPNRERDGFEWTNYPRKFQIPN